LAIKKRFQFQGEFEKNFKKKKSKPTKVLFYESKQAFEFVELLKS
jgi:hypothetical protein